MRILWRYSGALSAGGSAPRWREEALQPVEVLRLDVSEGVRASLDCRHRRVHWQDAHQYEKEPSNFSERYEMFTRVSLWVCECVCLSSDVTSSLGFLRGCVFSVMDAAVKRRRAANSGIRIRRVSVLRCRLICSGCFVFFIFNIYKSCLCWVALQQHAAASLDGHQQISWRNICYCPPVSE